jgi:hypothetical protein
VFSTATVSDGQADTQLLLYLYLSSQSFKQYLNPMLSFNVELIKVNSFGQLSTHVLLTTNGLSSGHFDCTHLFSIPSAGA